MTDEEIRAALFLWVKEYCNNDWETPPNGVNLFLDKALDWFKNQNGIVSETLGDYSVEFTDNIPKGLLAILRPYKRIAFK